MSKTIRTLVALALLASGPALFAQAKKTEPAAAPSAEAKSDAGKSDELKKTRPMPMNSRVDEIDAEAKTFTQNTRDGRKVKHIITAKTEINQGTKSATFEDIKVGDMVAGSRIKKNTEGTEYEIVKITKFGAKPKSDDKK